MVLSKFGLTNRVAIVMGACGRMGKETALVLADAGAHVVTVDRNPEVEAVAADIRTKGRKSLAFVAKLHIKEEVNDVVDRVVKELGRIDILVNAAGCFVDDEPPLVEISEQEFDRIFNENLKPVLLCSQAVAKVMMKQKKGAIININAAGWRTRVSWRQLRVMNAFKVANCGNAYLTEAMAVSWGPYGIRANCLSPRFIEVPGEDESTLPTSRRGAERAETMKIVPLGRFGKTSDIAYAVLYLASDAAEFINGAQLHVDGGPNI